MVLAAWPALMLVQPVQAQDAASAAQQQQELSMSINDLVTQDVQSGSLQDLTRVEVTLGQLDPRVRLTPCEQMEPFIPPGQRLWGSARVGIRCVKGQRPWQVYLPIQVRVYGTALVAAGPVAAGQTLTENDLSWQEVDWAASPAGIFTEPDQLIGRSSIRALQTGEPFRANMIRAPKLFDAGAVVRLLVNGPGFSVTVQGRALNHGLEGQPVRVRLDSGRVVQGQVVDDGTVEVRI